MKPEYQMTFAQWLAAAYRAKRAEYPTESRAVLLEVLAFTHTPLTHAQMLGKAIEAGFSIPITVLDRLSPEMLYNLKKHYAPVDSLDYYIPALQRTHRSFDPLPHP